MSGYAKLSSSIVLSTVWREPHTTRIVWITMLALADADGYVGASIPGLADAARVTLEECEQALAAFRRPDPYSRSKAHEGRRIVDADGGWIVLSYQDYRDGRDSESRRRQNREAKRRERERARARQHVSHDSADSQHVSQMSAHAEAEAEAEEREPPLIPPEGGTTKARRTRSSSKGAGKPRKWTRIPSDWQPKEEHRELAREIGVDVALEEKKIRDHEYARPKGDPDACFRAWLRNAANFGGGGRRGNTPRVQHAPVDEEWFAALGRRPNGSGAP